MTRRIATLALALVLLLPVVAAGQESLRLLDAVEELLDRGQARDALDMVERFITQSPPGSSEAWRLKARAHRELGDLDAALDDATKAIDLDPKNARAWNGRAIVRQDMKDLQAALRDVSKSIEIDPRYVKGWDSRAEIKLRLGDSAGAAADATRALALDPSFVPALPRRARALDNLKDYQGALRDCDRAIAVNRNDGAALEVRGWVLMHLKRWPEAIEAYSRCIELGRHPAQAYNNRGICHKRLGETAAAIADFEEALKKDPAYDLARSNLADARAKLQTAGALSGQEKAALGRETPGKGSAPAKGGLLVTLAPGSKVTVPPPVRAAEDRLWAKPLPATLAGFETDQPEVTVAALSDIARTTKALDLGGVAVAMEGMRALSGPLGAADEKRLNEKWQPYFDYTDEATATYFDQVNPLLEETLALRTLSARTARDFDRAWADAGVATLIGDTRGAVDALQEAQTQAAVLAGVNRRLARVARDAAALGNPPDPVAAKRKAREWLGKWSGPSEACHIAWLWRATQDSSQNIDNRFLAALAGPGPAPAESWPADEATWCRWFDAGMSGAEPRSTAAPPEGSTAGATAIVDEILGPKPANASMEQNGERIRIFRSTTPAQAAKAKLEGRRLDSWKTSQAAPPPPTAAPAPTPATAAPENPAVPALTEEEAKARDETIAEKKQWIQSIQKNLARDQVELAKEPNEARKADLFRRTLNDKAEIQHEQDLIASLQTGTIVHTRTEADDYCQALMIKRAEEHIEKVDTARRIAAMAEKATANGDREQQAQLKDFIEKNLSPADIARGDTDKARKVAKAVFDTVQGTNEGKAARAEEEAIRNAEMETGAYRLKVGADVSLLALGIGAPVYWAAAGVQGATTAVTGINAFYGFATGTYQGGLVEGIKQAVAQTSLAGAVAVETIHGYDRGSLVFGGGIAGAVERGVETFLLGKAVEAGASWIGGMARPGAELPAARGGGEPLPRPPTVQEIRDSAAFQKLHADAEAGLQRYREVAGKLQDARKAGASAETIAQLDAQRLAEAVAVNESFLAKRMLKAGGRDGRAGIGDPQAAALEGDFANAQRRIYQERVDPLFTRSVNDAGYEWRVLRNGQWVKAPREVSFTEFRHGGTAGTANTDRDFGLQEPPRDTGEIYQLYRKDQPMPLEEAEKHMQSLYEQAYRMATNGGNPTAAMQQITTSRSREAYREPLFTKVKENPNLIRSVEKGWVEQAVDVTRAKVNGHDPSLPEMVRRIDAANQTAKDIDERLLVWLKSKKATPEDVDRWKAVSAALKRVETDPVGASRELKALTGAESVSEVVEVVGKRLIGAVKLGR